MVSVQELKTQIENANALGIANLTGKGVEIPGSATTYEIMQSIAQIIGGGVRYTDIVYNTDDTITLTDADGAEHTMACGYEEGKLVSISFDGKPVELTYLNSTLEKIGRTNINLNNADTDVSCSDLDEVRFVANDEVHQVVWVKSGNMVNEPTQPIKEGSVFTGWKSGDEGIVFPFASTENCTLSAAFSSLIAGIYEICNASMEEYPHLFVQVSATNIAVYLSQSTSFGSGADGVKRVYYKGYLFTGTFPSGFDINLHSFTEVANAFRNYVGRMFEQDSYFEVGDSNKILYSNFVGLTDYTAYYLISE